MNDYKYVPMNSTICGDITCFGSCYMKEDKVFGSTYYYYKCYPKATEFFCENDRAGMWYLFIGLVLLTLVFFILAKSFADIQPLNCSIILNIFQSFAFAVLAANTVCVWTAYGFDFGKMAVMMVCTFFLIASVAIPRCPKYNLIGESEPDKESINYIKDIIKYDTISRDKLYQKIETLKKDPPQLLIKGFVSVDTMGIVVRHGATNPTKFIQRLPLQGSIPYNSWTDVSQSASIPDYSFMLLKIKPTFMCSEQINGICRTYYEQFLANTRMQYPTASALEFEIVHELSDLKKPVLVYGNSVPLYHKFISSGFGKFIYILSCFLGLNTVFESIWCLSIKKVKIMIEKSIN